MRGRAGAEALLADGGIPLHDYILQANVRSTLRRGKKCNLRCYGAFFDGRPHYLPSEVLVTVHRDLYTEADTDPMIHVKCTPNVPQVISMSGDEFFAELASAEHCAENCSTLNDLREATRSVLRMFVDECVIEG